MELNMALKFALLHIFIHLAIVVAIFIAFSLNSFYFFVVLFASAIIDLDHLPFLIKHGFKHWYKISFKLQKQQAYPFHNFLIIFISFLGSFLILSNFFIGICFLSIFLHLFWDFFGDVFILKMNFDHWKIRLKNKKLVEL
jgi:hypothetical protein